MKNKAFLVSFVAFFAMILTLTAVAAVEYTGDIVSDLQVKVNDIPLVLGEITLAGEVSETVPVEIRFKAEDDSSDVKIRIYTEGYNSDASEYTPRFRIVNGSTYVKRLSLKLPSDMDMDSDPEELSLYVRVYTRGEGAVEKVYTIRLQKQGYSLNLLSIYAPSQASAGSNVPVEIVLQNNGNERLDNVYVKASIPELNIERVVYFGDLGPTEESEELYYNHIRDATERILYLPIPRNAVAGNYDIEIEAYNYDTSITAKKKIVVSGLESGVLPGTSAKTIAIGEEATFNLVLVNPNERMVVYSVVPEEAKGLTVTVDQPVIAVPADSSKTVEVKVKATDSAEEGTYLVTVNVNTDSGLAKQVSYSVTVQKTPANDRTTPGGITVNGVLILTVILVIIFVVLLIVLIVLLTRKPAETEEFGETSYY